MTWINSIIVICVLGFLPAIAVAQSPDESGDSLRIYLITLGPGADPWEKFGHDFIDVEDSDPNRSLVDPNDETKSLPFRVSYNWGVFDFGNGVSGFISFGWRFLQGRLLYSMRGASTDEVVNVYTGEGRYILKQELQLTGRQKSELLRRLELNDTDANRYYLYDYFFKNCSTMTRDAIDQAIDGRAHETLAKISTRTTLRLEDRRCTADDKWLYAFLDYALGHAIDQPISAWEESFLPEKLATHLKDVMVPGPDGKLLPLIKSEQVLSQGIYPERTAAPSFFLGFLGTGLGLGALLSVLAFLGDRSRVARWSFKIIGSGWSLLVGLLGFLLTFSWFTDHQAAKWNENWFQGNVLSLLLVVLIPACHRWPGAARKVSLVVLGLSVFGLLVKVLPWFYQMNGQIIAAVLPVQAAIAWGTIRLNRAVISADPRS